MMPTRSLGTLSASLLHWTRSVEDDAEAAILILFSDSDSYEWLLGQAEQLGFVAQERLGAKRVKGLVKAKDLMNLSKLRGVAAIAEST